MKKKLLSLLMTAVLVIAMACPVMASDPGTWAGQDGNGYGGTFTSDPSGAGTSSGTTKVTATISSTYHVVVPATIALTMENAATNLYAGTSNIGCYGNIAADKKVHVAFSGTDAAGNTEVANTFAMTNGTENVDASVIAGFKPDFVKAVNAGNEATSTAIGADASHVANSPFTVNATLQSAGAYTGTLTVAFELTDI